MDGKDEGAEVARDPVDRAHSNWQHLVRLVEEGRLFAEIGRHGRLSFREMEDPDSRVGNMFLLPWEEDLVLRSISGGQLKLIHEVDALYRVRG
jgi:hypothetical protein